MKHQPLIVTDHCVLRYLERVQGQPIEAVRDHIRKLCEGPAALQAKCVRAEGVRFEIQNNHVVTTRPDGTMPSRTSKALAQEKVRR